MCNLLSFPTVAEPAPTFSGIFGFCAQVFETGLYSSNAFAALLPPVR